MGLFQAKIGFQIGFRSLSSGGKKFFLTFEPSKSHKTKLRRDRMGAKSSIIVSLCRCRGIGNRQSPPQFCCRRFWSVLAIQTQKDQWRCRSPSSPIVSQPMATKRQRFRSRAADPSGPRLRSMAIAGAPLSRISKGTHMETQATGGRGFTRASCRASLNCASNRPATWWRPCNSRPYSMRATVRGMARPTSCGWMTFGISKRSVRGSCGWRKRSIFSLPPRGRRRLTTARRLSASPIARHCALTTARGLILRGCRSFPHSTRKENIGIRIPRWAAALFRVGAGPFRAEDLKDGKFLQFADAQTLRRFNTHLVSRDLSRALPGDLLFFRRQTDPPTFHGMIYVGESKVRPDGRRYLLYHTGPTGSDPGEIRRPTVDEMMRFPQPEWRPIAANPAFLGVMRWNILRGSETESAE